LRKYWLSGESVILQHTFWCGNSKVGKRGSFGYPFRFLPDNSEIKYLPDYAIEKVCKYFKLKKEDLACYGRMLLRKKHSTTVWRM
jgi:hypothetical protein